MRARKKKQDYELFESKLGSRGLNPLQLIDLRKAVKAGKTTAVLQGKEFIIEEKGASIWYQCKGQSIPCGYINKDALLKGLL